MQPVACIHCGYNYMRRTTEPDAIRLCNSCEVRENLRNPKKEDKMQHIEILIKIPQADYVKIEEVCINEGKNASRYFLELHYANEAITEEMKKYKSEINKKNDLSSIKHEDPINYIKIKDKKKI